MAKFTLLFVALFATAAAADEVTCAGNLDDDVALLQQEAFIAHRGFNAEATKQEGAQNKTAAGGVTAASVLRDLTEVSSVEFGAVLAEYLAMTLFVVIGCGSAMGIAKEPGSAWVLQVSLTFGFAITALAYSIGTYSGGHINCAVTLGLVLVGEVSIAQGILNFIAQMLGSITGAYLLTGIFPKDQDKTGGLGSNAIADGFGKTNVFVGEAIMTFLLMFVVLETAVNPNSEDNRALACVAIGFAVFLAHTVLIPIDGCSINPTRSFGPALVASQRYGKGNVFKDMAVFFAAPLTGAALASAVYTILRAV